MSDEGPGGYVVILFGSEGNQDCSLDKCVMEASWFADREAARSYMARMPDWTVPHCLPLTVPFAPADGEDPDA